MAEKKICSFSLCTSSVDIFFDLDILMKLKMDFLNHRQMELILVQGYKGIKDKEKANEYAVNGSS